MKHTEGFSDEFLNAFIDGQLDEAERSRLLAALREDEDLSRRLCRLRKVRDMVQLAYLEIPDRAPVRTPPRPRPHRGRAAAALLMALAGLGGWLAHDRMAQPSLAELAEIVQTNTPAGDTWQLVIHIPTDDTYRLRTALEETENLLRRNQARGRKVMVEILTNGRGLKLLRTDTSPFAQRIRKMQREYQTVRFAACGKTIQRLKLEQGLEVGLLPGAVVVPSALAEIMKRQQEGWTYIRI